ncbi:MAG TPA: hypothetical protein ENI65_06380 [Gammaproteobacteria bacterium]|nr:hypothetical protein [Gammaproteobacteria bacterium]
MSAINSPEALLLTSTHCQHCHTLELLLHKRLADGRLKGLDVINIEQSPELVKQHNARSVPWLQLGTCIFDEALTPGELDHWIALITDNQARSPYLEYLLSNGKLDWVLEWFEHDKACLNDLIAILIKDDVKMNVRIGISAVMERYEDTDAIRKVVPELAKLIQHEDPVIRMDACHYLTLTRSDGITGPINNLLNDEDRQVRQIAQECLEEIVEMQNTRA